MRDVCRDFETDLVEFNGESNHIHQLSNVPPKVAIAKLINSLKGVSSRRMRQEFPDLRRHYYRANKLWSARTSPVPSAAPREVPSASTSSSTTTRPKAPSGPATLPHGPSPPR
ncbi:hypothetical protein Pfl04_33900 [Planosporangium flavigriseum]|uniref:Transposase IS200-like domain-containing protein n=1 Tax=Planosporangium flavigriseum TaxID=373681 RepID=A0A8J3PLY8_9ACTN|nr:hypothetical protein Pfl04_33900 [Planosporangium flavigriseum]